MSSPLILLLLFILASGSTVFSASLAWDHEKCDSALHNWAQDALEDLARHQHGDRRSLKELLFFLHVPRTGGRTYHQCLLRNLYPPEQHCDRSYDKLRFNSSQHCKLLVTHDDYSVLAKLPSESTSVVTNMRHPVDRVFSAYEFSVEVASRFLARNSKRKNSLSRIVKNPGSSTLNIWPWSELVPWMRDDLVSRQASRRSGEVAPPVSEVTHYNASAYVMPLHEFIQQPLVMNLLHNGATYQVAGLTSNSYLKGADNLRKCVISHPDLGHHVLTVAKRRVERMIFVGLTEKHKDTAVLFANMIGGQLYPLGYPTNTSTRVGLQNSGPSALKEPVLGLVKSPEYQKISGVTAENQISELPSKTSTQDLSTSNVTVYGLIEKYESCAGRLRDTQVQRRIFSLRNALPINFSTEARHQVAEATLETIRKMNNLDLELYAYAQQLYSKSQIEESQSPTRKVLFKKVLTVEKGNDWWYSTILGSRKLLFAMVFFMCGGLVTLGARFAKISSRSRILMFQAGQNHILHEKV